MQTNADSKRLIRVRLRSSASHCVLRGSYLTNRRADSLTQPLHRIQCAGNDKDAIQENRRYARGRLADHAAAPPPLRAVSHVTGSLATASAAIGCRRHAVFLEDDGVPRPPRA